MRGRRPDGLGRLGAATVRVLACGTQDTVKARLGGQVDTLIGQHRHDARRRYVSKARLVGYLQQTGTLGLG